MASPRSADSDFTSGCQSLVPVLAVLRLFAGGDGFAVLVVNRCRLICSKIRCAMVLKSRCANSSEGLAGCMSTR